MKKKPLVKAMSVIVVCVLLLGFMLLPASAGIGGSGVTKKQLLTMDNKYPNGYWAYMTTTFYPSRSIPIPSTQCEHKAGASTTLSVNTSVTKTDSASASLGCSATTELGVTIAGLANEALSQSLSATLQVGMSVTYTVAASVQYTLGPNVEAGLYRLKIVFPRRAVAKRVTGIDKNDVEKILWRESVEYAPRVDDAYCTWEKYGNAG